MKDVKIVEEKLLMYNKQNNIIAKIVIKITISQVINICLMLKLQTQQVI